MPVIEALSHIPRTSITRDFWPANPPHIYQLVRSEPWDGWALPSGQPGSEQDDLAQWFQLLGKVLFEVQEGLRPPFDVGAMVPPPFVFAQAMEWIFGLEVPREARSKPRRTSRRLQALRSRAIGVECLRAGMVTYGVHIMPEQFLAWPPQEPPLGMLQPGETAQA